MLLQSLLEGITTGIHHRAELLIPLLVAGFLGGEFLARYAGIDAVLGWCVRTASRLASKLNRPDRSIATRLYRGIIVTGMFVLPAMVLGLVVNDIAPLALLLLVALFGRAFATHALFRLWRRAQANSQKLELPESDFLFADSHAVLRYVVLLRARAFAVGVVGICFWYLVGGLPMVLGYVALAEIVAPLTVPVFGWAASSLFRMVHAIPAALALVFLTLGACFTPRAKPFAVFRARSYNAAVARLLHVALGGTLPQGNVPWVGAGTPKLLPEHLARWLLLRLAATTWLLVALATPKVINTLNLFVN